MEVRPVPLVLALLVQLAPLLACPADAQRVPALLRVGVHSADGRQPLGGALVSARGLGLIGVTGPDGFVTFTGLPPGAHAVQARYLGYGTLTMHVRLEPGGEVGIDFALPIEPIILPGVQVRARPSVLSRSGFFDRQHAGGTFITREEIEQMRPRMLSDVLRRLPGITLTPSVAGTARPSMRGSGRPSGSCPIQYYVDGTMVAMLNIDDIPASDVEGLEIYRGAATVPPVFNKGSAICGVIVIWTRI
jgi:hypothetical protein